MRHGQKREKIKNSRIREHFNPSSMVLTKFVTRKYNIITFFLFKSYLG